MRLLRPCRIQTEDDIHPEANNAAVTIIGESPRATVRIALPNEAGRYVAIDTLSAARVRNGPNGTFEIHGSSTYLREHIGAPTSDSDITVIVSPPAPCKDCPK